MNDRIWLSPPDMGPRERALLLDAFDSNWIAPLGPHLEALEVELAAASARDHCAAVASGTAALHLGLRALGVQPDDLVMTSTQTFVATANAVVHAGARPVFIDSEPERQTMDPGLLDIACKEVRAEGRKIGAILPVDIYGQCANYEAIEEVASAHDTPVLADAAGSLGSREHGRPAASNGTAAIVSFNGNKIVTGSGGGAVLTDDAALAARVRFLATQAREHHRHYEHETVGYNERMSNLIAALIRGGLARLPEKLAQRGAIHERYRDALEGHSGVSFPLTPSNSQPNRWLTVIHVTSEGARDRILDTLDSRGIEARPTWKPMHLQPVYADARRYGGDVAEQAFRTGICLPSGSTMTPEQQNLVIAGIKDALRD